MEQVNKGQCCIEDSWSYLLQRKVYAVKRREASDLDGCCCMKSWLHNTPCRGKPAIWTPNRMSMRHARSNVAKTHMRDTKHVFNLVSDWPIILGFFFMTYYLQVNLWIECLKRNVIHVGVWYVSKAENENDLDWLWLLLHLTSCWHPA